MSTVPLINAAMPVPDPPPDTSTDTAGSTFAYSSAQACARLTIVSEPVFWMIVLSGSFVPEQPNDMTRTAAPTDKAATQRSQAEAWNLRRGFRANRGRRFRPSGRDGKPAQCAAEGGRLSSDGMSAPIGEMFVVSEDGFHEIVDVPGD